MEPKQVKLTLYHYLLAEQFFPSDPKGKLTASYGKQVYKCKNSVTDHSQILNEMLEQDTKVDLSHVLIRAKSEEALDLLMKLLVGFKDVVVPKSLWVQFCYMLHMS